MASVSGSIAENLSLMMQGIVESLLFVAAVYYIPGIMASLVTGGTGAAISAGETILAGIAGEGASQAASTGKAIGGAATDGATAAAKAAADGAAKAMSKLQAMLMR